MNYNQPATLQVAILDWAGTVVDFGPLAPAQIFVETFAEFGVQVSLEETRDPMGMGKWDHIRTLCDIPVIAERYRAVFGRLPSDDDVTVIYERFMPLQIEKIAEHSALIPGALQAIAELRGMGLEIGSRSGCPVVVMERVVALAGTNGYVADHVVATDEVPNGRPWPAQALASVITLRIDDVAACVRIDDIWPGILEGRRAGMWTVALTCPGNTLDLIYEQYKVLPAAELECERTRIEQTFEGSRPHYLIETVAELPAVVRDINARLARGEMPQGNWATSVPRSPRTIAAALVF